MSRFYVQGCEDVAEVWSKLRDVVHARRATPGRQRNQEACAGPAAIHRCEQGGRNRRTCRRNGLKASEECETQQRCGHRAEKPIFVLVRIGVAEKRCKQKSLCDDFRIGVARVPRLDDVDREQTSGGSGGERPYQPRAREVHGQHTENRPPGDNPPRPGNAVKSIRDRYPDWISLRKLPADDPRVRIAQVKAHETQAVVPGVAVARKKQVARGSGHR